MGIGFFDMFGLGIMVMLAVDGPTLDGTTALLKTIL